MMNNETPVRNPADLTPAERAANIASHTIGVVDDCYRCIDCEIGSWNAWKENCRWGGR